MNALTLSLRLTDREETESNSAQSPDSGDTIAMSVESGYYSSNIESNEEEDEITITELLLQLNDIDEDMIFHENGYRKISKICDTLQGELYKAEKLDKSSFCKQSYVAIKKTDKCLLQKRIAIQDDINFVVSENIIKEALILKYLTVDNKPIGDYIIKYIDFFQSDTDYYLVMEYIDSCTNLKQFVSKSQQHIQNGTLSIKQYRKMMKYVLWQLFVTVQWLHTSMHCCHLDLCMENIMLTDAKFIQTNDGLAIDPNIAIKIGDFGVAEIFKIGNKQINSSNSMDFNLFLCEKQGLSLENEGYFDPKIFNGDIYDAEAADNWSLGMLLFECMTVGRKLYGPQNMYDADSGYSALYDNKLKKYLSRNNLLKFFSSPSFNLLNGLLNIDDKKRMKGIEILKHKWFALYFNKYHQRILKKFNLQRKQSMKQQQKIDPFPFYR